MGWNAVNAPRLASSNTELTLNFKQIDIVS
jgi:hypothetical protein